MTGYNLDIIQNIKHIKYKSINISIHTTIFDQTSLSNQARYNNKKRN